MVSRVSMRGKTVGVVLLAATMSAPPAWAQGSHREGDPVVMGRQFVVPSSVLGEDRPITVGVPLGYDSTEAHPVIYALDGLGHFFHTWSSVRHLAGNDRMPRAIVVSIGNTEGNRSLNMTPPLTVAEEGMPTGGSADFRAFLRDELKPWIESRYATEPYDILVGHSFGGLFISDVLNHEPELFDAYISISPSLWWDDEHYVAGMDDLFDRHPHVTGSLYMTMGNEGGDMLSGAWRLAGTLEKHAPPSFRWEWVHMPDETHGSVPARSVYDGLEWIFADWNPATLYAELERRGAEVMPRIATHFAETSELVGFEVPLPVSRVGGIVFSLNESGRTDTALGIAEALVGWAPDDWEAVWALGETHAAACQDDEALSYMRRAIGMATEVDAGGVVEYLNAQLGQLEARIEEGRSCPEP